jgi:hypothetical protein
LEGEGPAIEPQAIARAGGGADAVATRGGAPARRR